jgi:hypothetical protein
VHSGFVEVAHVGIVVVLKPPFSDGCSIKWMVFFNNDKFRTLCVWFCFFNNINEGFRPSNYYYQNTKTSINCMKKIVSTIMLHLSVWIVWFAFDGLGYWHLWYQFDKLPMLYNYVSLVLVFYSICHFARMQFNKLSYEVFDSQSGLGKIKYLLFRSEAFAILGITQLYIWVSWYVDVYVFKMGYNDFAIYWSSRLSREMYYVSSAISVAFFLVYKTRRDMQDMVKDARIFQLEEFKEKKLREYDEEMEKMREMIRMK